MSKKVGYYVHQFSRISGFFILCLTLINILFYPEFANNDWVGYENIFEKSNFIIFNFKNTPNIAPLSSLFYIFTHFFDYSTFRSFFAFIQSSLFFIFLYKIKYNFLKFDLIKIVPIVLFLLFKVHIQIRECVSIILWMISLLDINKGKFFSFKNYIICFISIINHYSILLFWLSSFIIESKFIPKKRKGLAVFLVFFMMGIFISPFLFKNYFYQIFYGIKGINLNLVNINLAKLIYWILYLLIYAKIFFEELSYKKGNVNYSNLNTIDVFRNLGLFGSLGLISITLVTSFFGVITKDAYNILFRYLLNLFILLSIYRSYQFPRKISTILLNLLMLSDVFRMIIYPQSPFYPLYLFDIKLAT